MTPAGPPPWGLDAAADLAGRWLSAGGHLGMVMLASAVVYPLVGMLGRRARDARAAREVEYLKPTLQAVSLANGASRYEVEYGKAQPIVSVTLVFPEGRFSATCRDASYEGAVMSALGLVLASRAAARAAREAAGRAPGTAEGAEPTGGRGPTPPPPPPDAGRPRVPGAIDDRTPWHEVLGVPEDAGKREVKAAFRSLAQRFHPDRGGSGEMMRHLVRAKAQGLAAT